MFELMQAFWILVVICGVGIFMYGFYRLSRYTPYSHELHNIIYHNKSKISNNTNDKPKIVCLCGSTRYKDAFEMATKEESLKGHIILSVAMFGHLEGLKMDGPEKKIFDELHLRKIDLCDEVLVLNVGNKIGESTSNEIAYALSIGKPIRYLKPYPKYKLPWKAKTIKVVNKINSTN